MWSKLGSWVAKAVAPLVIRAASDYIGSQLGGLRHDVTREVAKQKASLKSQKMKLKSIEKGQLNKLFDLEKRYSDLEQAQKTEVARLAEMLALPAAKRNKALKEFLEEQK